MGDYFTEEPGILPNKLGVDDPELLKAIEVSVVMVRLIWLEENPINGEIGFDHLCAIHRYSFSDLYHFAGVMRDVWLAKDDGVFCYPENLEGAQQAIFTQLKHDKLLKGLGKPEFIEKLATLTGDLIALHPFREGNGRSVRAFLKQLAENAGYDLNYEDVRDDELLSTDIATFKGNLAPLKELLHRIVSPVAV
ncbi:MAG: Fic family protein [Limnochordia bacterium]|nr:Fic family protein [Limnochordia bacterium]MDD4518685.1 Fic family protein [Limnochordia bacterium]